MDVRRFIAMMALIGCLSGCAVSSSSKNCETESTTLDIGPMIGLFGMAVDGDDKDDYEHFFDNDDCKCRH